jgi:hypothetical protein
MPRFILYILFFSWSRPESIFRFVNAERQPPLHAEVVAAGLQSMIILVAERQLLLHAEVVVDAQADTSDEWTSGITLP